MSLKQRDRRHDPEKKYGHDVLLAADGQTGLDVLREHGRIDLLLTDIMLPGGLNGSQLATAAQAEFSALKILFMSGYGNDIIIRQGRLAPNVPLLTKPFTPEKLIEYVGEILSGDDDLETTPDSGGTANLGAA